MELYYFIGVIEYCNLNESYLKNFNERFCEYIQTIFKLFLICINELKPIQEKENEVKKNKDEYYLSPEIKVNVEWFKDGNENVDILFCTNSNKKLALHWGVSNANSQGNWSHIDSLCYPPLTKEFDNFALQTEFSFLENDNSAQKIHIKFPKDDFNSLNFVFLEKDANRWYNNGEKDYHIYFN